MTHTKNIFLLRKSSIAVKLLAIALFGSQFNYLLLSILFPGDDKRYVATGISPELFFGSIFIGGTIFLYIENKSWGSYRRYSIPFMILISATIMMFISIIYNGVGFRPLITLLAFILYFWSARYLMSKYLKIISYQLKKWLILIPPLFIILLIYFFVTDRIVFLTEGSVEFLRPQIQGGIRSTEVAIFVGLQFIYLLYCFDVSQNKIERRVIFILIIALLCLLIVLFSVGAIIGIIFVLFLKFLLFKRNKILTLWKSIFIVFITGMVGILLLPESSTVFFWEFLKEVLQFKLNDLLETGGIRNSEYSLLWTMAIDNPVFGIGWGNFVKSNTISYTGQGSYPHNNLLGIGAENGLISAVFYSLFIFSIIIFAVWTFTKKKYLFMNKKRQNVGHFFFMAFSCFVFLQLRGFFQDTWQIKEIYIWAGILVGTIDWLRANRDNSKFQNS